jgi:nitroreductase
MKTSRRNWMRMASAGGTGLALAPAASAARNEESGAAAILELFPKRQSVRRYKSDAVPEEHLRLILDAARRAPTCMNQQPWKFLVIRDKEKIAKMRRRLTEIAVKPIEDKLKQQANVNQEDLEPRNRAVATVEGYMSAPVYVAVLMDNQCMCGPEYAKHDGPMAAGYLMLAARALGYGTVYLTDTIPENVMREVWNVPDRYHRVCVTPIGVPDGWPPPKPKKKLEELVAWETL